MAVMIGEGFMYAFVRGKMNCAFLAQFDLSCCGQWQYL